MSSRSRILFWFSTDYQSRFGTFFASGSSGWKKSFQGLALLGVAFPRFGKKQKICPSGGPFFAALRSKIPKVGKIRAHPRHPRLNFSKGWKIFFQCLESGLLAVGSGCFFLCGGRIVESLRSLKPLK
jgi:hypothetical protein